MGDLHSPCYALNCVGTAANAAGRLASMPVYLVTPLAQNFDTVKGSTLKKIQETEIFELPNKAGLLVNYKGTSFELSEFIGISALKNKEKADEPYLGPAMVTSIGSYFGRGPTVMWEWMQNRFENQ